MNSLISIILIAVIIWGYLSFKKNKELKEKENLLKKLEKRREEREKKKQKEKEFEANRTKLTYNQGYNIDSIVKAEVVTDTKVAGVSHNSISGKPRQQILRTLNSREILDLIPEPDNPHDPNAIMVTNKDGFDVGYLPKSIAKEISPKTNDFDFFAIVNSVTGWDMPTKGLNIKVLRLPK
ncbi:HIRAN domain-containing protein [Rhodohalobacter sulfatireducens]|uniref:HIRAN domain-containing protein n=1 Tax=Rhodohalobacter sulfatireducens TaxID=2911366 RepID=A0ABS9KAL8_9BACT|nr:HIRAN domain-containing protein [Rhodohalobacter sulfatireducens]MCG2587897.1 HIRAN domain-containing protein [Rhodohalobacter sulfatireducens]